MLQNRSPAGIFVLSLTPLAGCSVPTAAEFFGCNDREGHVLSNRTIVT